MKCRSLLRFLSDYVDGDLPTATARRIGDHNRVCPTCRRVIQTLKTAVLCLKNTPRLHAAARARRALRRKIAALRRPGPPRT
ncbi:MAG TPA: zf-HC2 domain-containing protein [Elusimicrobiota bacterium]|nr:zf-HC2 domain-containing protein [Elusimicrobiota bacterium]